MSYFNHRKTTDCESVDTLKSEGILKEPAQSESISEKASRLELQFDDDTIEFLKLTNGLKLPGDRWIDGVEKWNFFSLLYPQDFTAQMDIFEPYGEGGVSEISVDEYLDYENAYGLGNERFEYLPSCIVVSGPAKGIEHVSYKDYGYALLNPNIVNNKKMEIWNHSSWDNTRYASIYDFLQSCYQARAYARRCLKR